MVFASSTLSFFFSFLLLLPPLFDLSLILIVNFSSSIDLRFAVFGHIGDTLEKIILECHVWSGASRQLELSFLYMQIANVGSPVHRAGRLAVLE
jgi:hypothetical protein